MTTSAIETLVASALRSVSTGGEKVYFIVAPQDCKPPFTVISVSALTPEVTLGGVTDLWNVQCGIEIVGNSYPEVSAKIQSAIVALYQAGTFKVGSISRGDDVWDADVGFYVGTLTVSIWYRDST